MFCLRPEYLEKVKQAIKDGKFDTEKFNTDSETRRTMLAEIVGKENAEGVNTAYEQKLLLKNQESAMYNFVKEITGLSKEQKAATLEKVREAHADRNRRLFDPKEGEHFLNEITSDIYSKKYGTDVSLEQAQEITELAHDAKVAKADLVENGKTGYGAAKVALDNYVNALKIDAKKSTGGLVNFLKEQGFGGKINALAENAKISVNFIAENSRAIVASMDNSLWFRQGIKSLMDPRTTGIWAKDFAHSWSDIGKTIIGKSAIETGDAITDAVKAQAYERPAYLKGWYDAKPSAGSAGTKLDIGTGEEAFPTSIPAKIPLLGRFFKGSEVAYEVGAMRLRMDIADKFYTMAEKSGVDMTDNKAVGDINQTVNMMTGRSTFGKRVGGSFEKGVNNAFFSIKFFKANLDYLTSPVRYLLDVNSEGKKIAAQNLLYTVATTGVVLKLAQALNPEDNKDIFNPTSSNFGRIRNGHMTIDLTGGAGGIIVAASKIILQESTSGTTGIKKPLGSGYGSQTGMDVLWSFTENKFSPMFGLLRDLIKQKNYQGQKPTILNEGPALVTPISIQNISQFHTEPAAMQLIGLVADGVGLNTNVYVPQTDWGENTSKEMKQFSGKVGADKFKEANDLFNHKFSDWFDKVQENPKYQKLADDQKMEEITKKKVELKEKVFRQYGFFYREESKKPLPRL